MEAKYIKNKIILCEILQRGVKVTLFGFCCRKAHFPEWGTSDRKNRFELANWCRKLHCSMTNYPLRIGIINSWRRRCSSHSISKFESILAPSTCAAPATYTCQKHKKHLLRSVKVCRNDFFASSSSSSLLLLLLIYPFFDERILRTSWVSIEWNLKRLKICFLWLSTNAHPPKLMQIHNTHAPLNCSKTYTCECTIHTHV